MDGAREAIRAFLEANHPTIRNWYQPYRPTKDTTKPYGVIAKGSDLGAVNNSIGRYVSFELWHYHDTGDFRQPDATIAETKALLSPRDAEGNPLPPPVLVTAAGAEFTLEFVMIGPDVYDETLEAIGQYVEYRIPHVL